jgi:hypothetical protein
MAKRGWSFTALHCPPRPDEIISALLSRRTEEPERLTAKRRHHVDANRIASAPAPMCSMSAVAQVNEGVNSSALAGPCGEGFCA